VKNPQYTLLLVNGSAALSFFSQASSGSDEGILWKRFLENPDSSVKNFEMAEEKMLKASLDIH